MLDLRQLDLNLLLAFDAVYQQRSVTRAAQVMNLSQPAMSNALRRLRTLCGDPLFIKSKQGVTPTLAAHRLADYVRNALDSLRDEAPVLLDEGTVEPHGPAQLGDPLRRRLVAEQDLGRIPRHHVQQQKHDDADPEQEEEGVQGASRDVAQRHGVDSTGSAPGGNVATRRQRGDTLTREGRSGRTAATRRRGA